jgi:plastocyanin
MVFQPLFDIDGGVFKGEGGFGESRMNKATYDFVWKNKIYSLKGLRAFASKKAPLSFPVDSMEVKAAWIELTPDLLQAGADKRYYTAEYDGKKYGLSSLHIITKDVPNWFWCTFHQKESPNTGFETPDIFGQPTQLKGTVWENYKLGGTQTDFVTTIGQPTLLSDPYIEKGFEKSSCISCHARASIDETGRGLSSKPVVGPPNPADFTNDGKPVFTAIPRSLNQHTVAEYTVTIEDFVFDPEDLKISIGDTVVWRNDGSVNHTASRDEAPAFDTGMIPPATSSGPIRFSAASAGALKYFCRPHKTMMQATITVT